MNNDDYGWSINVSINPKHFMLIVVWRGDWRYMWNMRTPLHVDKRLIVL